MKMMRHLRFAFLSLLLAATPAIAQEKEPEVIPLIAVDSYATTALWTLVVVAVSLGLGVLWSRLECA